MLFMHAVLRECEKKYSATFLIVKAKQKILERATTINWYFKKKGKAIFSKI